MIYYTVPVYASQDCLSPRNALCLRCTHCRDMHRRVSEPLTIYHRLWSVFVRSRRREVNLSHNQRATRMTPSTFEQWCRTLALAPSTRDSLTTIRDGHPVRRVTSRAGNVSGMYPSRKMGVTIQFESQKVELWAILVMDHDPDVLEFYDQPHTFKLRYLDKSGKKMQGHYYTPDFLVLSKKSVCFEEWKTEADLKRLAAAGQTLGHLHGGCLRPAFARCLPDLRSTLLPVGDDGAAYLRATL